MASKDEIVAVVLFAILALIIVITVELGTVDVDTAAKLKGARLVAVVDPGRAYALLSRMKIIKASTGVCDTIYAASSPENTEPDVAVLICGTSAYIYYLR